MLKSLRKYISLHKKSRRSMPWPVISRFLPQYSDLRTGIPGYTCKGESQGRSNTDFEVSRATAFILPTHNPCRTYFNPLHSRSSRLNFLDPHIHYRWTKGISNGSFRPSNRRLRRSSDNKTTLWAGIRSNCLHHHPSDLMVYFSWGVICICWSSAIDVVYFAVDRGYFICCEKCAEHCEDDCGG